MANSYEYSIGSVRAREKHLLSKADIEAMLACKTVPALLTFLADKGYAEGSSVDALIRNSRRETMAYLQTIVPDISVFNVFLYPFDVHNIKAVMKSLLADTDYTPLLMQPCTIETAVIEQAVKDNKYTLLPEAFATAAEEAYRILAHTTDARLADACLDKACMALQLTEAKQIKIPFLLAYIQTDIFYRNVKIALRGALTGAPVSYYEAALSDDAEGFNKKEAIACALKDADTLCDYLAGKDVYHCADAIEAFRQSPALFERYTESLLTQMAVEQCKRSGSGAEPALGYYLARAEEHKAIRMIANGIETGADPDTIRERLRELYG